VTQQQFHLRNGAFQLGVRRTGWLKKVSCCTVITAYFFLSHPVYDTSRQQPAVLTLPHSRK